MSLLEQFSGALHRANRQAARARRVREIPVIAPAPKQLRRFPTPNKDALLLILRDISAKEAMTWAAVAPAPLGSALARALHSQKLWRYWMWKDFQDVWQYWHMDGFGTNRVPLSVNVSEKLKVPPYIDGDKPEPWKRAYLWTHTMIMFMMRVRQMLMRMLTLFMDMFMRVRAG